MTNGPRPLDQFRKRLEAFTEAARRIDSDDVEGVHQTRVASRRLRELLPVLGLDSDSAQKFSRRLKKITKQLGTVRELDVLRLMIRQFALDPRYSSTALNQVSAPVERDCRAAHDSISAKLPFQKIQRLARRLQRAAEQSKPANGPRQPSPLRPGRALEWAVKARAARRAATVRSAIETAGTVYVPERLHDVRIAVKKLRYALEIGAGARSQGGNRAIAVLRAAQDLLGRLHDLETLIGRARDEQASLSPPTLTAWRELDALVNVLEADCRVLHADYLRDRAKLIAIADRLCGAKRHAVVASRRAVG